MTEAHYARSMSQVYYRRFNGFVFALLAMKQLETVRVRSPDLDHLAEARCQ